MAITKATVDLALGALSKIPEAHVGVKTSLEPFSVGGATLKGQTIAMTADQALAVEAIALPDVEVCIEALQEALAALQNVKTELTV